VELNPFEVDNYLRYGMCLDWLKNHGEAEKWFKRALQVDNNSYYTAALMGWHYIQVGDLETARKWLLNSVKLEPYENPAARSYLALIAARTAEPATSTK
jgi:tetratricopeptide (TPR) repeat protein